MKVTKKQIQAKIKDVYGVDIELAKHDGFYYWYGEATTFFDESCTYIQYLSDYSFERWIEDFKIKAENALQWMEYSSLKEAVENTNWSLD